MQNKILLTLILLSGITTALFSSSIIEDYEQSDDTKKSTYNKCTRAVPGTENRWAAAGWTDGSNWQSVADDITATLKNRKLRLLLVGNSITQGWGGNRNAVRYKPGKEVMDETLGQGCWESAGISGDCTQHLLWRLQHDDYNSCRPENVVIAIGINNLITENDRPEDVAEGIIAVAEQSEKVFPDSRIILLGLLPAGQNKNSPIRLKCDRIHQILKGYSFKRAEYVNPSGWFLTDTGELTDGLYSNDYIHLTTAGYKVMALQLKKILAGTSRKKLFVSPSGSDSNDGDIDSPLRTLKAALKKMSVCEEKTIEICLREGVFHLNSPDTITPPSGKKVIITSWHNERAVISGARDLQLNWQRVKGTLWKAPLKEGIDRLWINGDLKVMARFPNYREKGLFHGTSRQALDKKQIKKWKNPKGGFIHAMHESMWGSQHYEISGKENGSLIIKGGYQISRPSPLHASLRYVENIREELDTLNEWFWDENEHTLYYYARPDENLRTAKVEGTSMAQLVRIMGSDSEPVNNVTLRGLTFEKTRRTFMEPYEVLLRSDWGIYRGAAVFLENTKNCSVVDCTFKDLGGNALFVSKLAFNDSIRGNHLYDIGGSAICLVGDTSAVRSGAYGYSNFIPYDKMDLTPGPKNDLYPSNCVVEDNLIHDIGLVEKQVTGVELQITALNEIRHNSIYNVPRAGINIGDGAFGGHIIEYNDVFKTVLETGDHGAFNSWGRDRFWHPDYNKMVKLTTDHPELILKDALYTTLIRYNRFRCDHGWDIDLDDGSSNYHIYSNVCLQGGIKLREGFYRKVENNIVLNNSLHPHVWFPDSRDIFHRNIFMQAYQPIALNGWGEEIDFNLFATADALSTVRKNGTDVHSIYGKLDFVNSKEGNYTVKSDNETFHIGFQNFSMDNFSVISPVLKQIAERPDFPVLEAVESVNDNGGQEWQQMEIRSVKGLGDRSAFGLPDETGVIIVSVTSDSPAWKAGLRSKDVIREINGKKVSSVESLFSFLKKIQSKILILTIMRNQKKEEISYMLQ